jgi:hypothetical protein
MRFKQGIPGYLLAGIVFAVISALVGILYVLVTLPLVLIPTGIIIVSGGSIPGMNYLGYIFGLLITIGGFVVLGWVVFYFYKKNTLIYKSK